MSALLAISTALPRYRNSQEELGNYYQKNAPDEDTKRRIRFVNSRSGIDTRYSVIPDFGLSGVEPQLFQNGNSPGISERMKTFEPQALELSLQSIRKLPDFESIKSRITHIITVTCTGLFAPGLDINLVRELELKPTINRSSLNFMGCNAAVLALKQADSICKGEPDALVLIVCTELCTLHFQEEYSDDYLLSNILFSDGSAAALVGNDSRLCQWPVAPVFEQFHSLLLHQGRNDMTWQLSEKGFLINLSSYVSSLICDNMKEMMKEIKVDSEKISDWAIHPGGPKILDDFGQAIPLEKDDLWASYSVLKQFGNMSSATILFVIQEIMAKKLAVNSGERLFSAAFGPGLSIESMTLRYV